jgi:two-component SAPR family response regulator
MKILTVDNERASLNILNRTIREVQPEAELQSFMRASDTLKAIRESGFRPDVVFMDIEMPGMTGIELAAEIKKSVPFAWIVFVTGYSQYALQAYSVHAGGYLMKPVAAEQIREELRQMEMQRQYHPAQKSGGMLQVRCFGNFEVYKDGIPFEFSRKKTKELFAYLIHKRGAACSTKELAAVLFEDAPYDTTQQSYIQTIIANLCHAFREADAEMSLSKNTMHLRSTRRKSTAITIVFFPWTRKRSTLFTENIWNSIPGVSLPYWIHGALCNRPVHCC